MGVTDLWLFLIAGLALNLTPGPDMAYVMARSARQGLKCGVLAALGIGAGCLVHIAAGAVGISALIAASATAFTVLKLIGAGYLVWLGIGMLMTRGDAAPRNDAAPLSPASPSAIFAEAFVINVFNPKVALFFLAFLPQFISADAPSSALAFVFLGTLFNATGTAWNVLVAIATARLAGAWKVSRRVGIWLERGMGAMFVALGARLALLKQT